MATYTSKAYECSKSNATVSSGTNSWVNEFSDPIELEPGDQVRVLGSFVNEASGGDSMEIIEGQNSVNINFMPYIKGSTFGTSVANDDLLTLGQIATPAYSTDAFGIEPPTSLKFEEWTANSLVPAPVPPATQKFSAYYGIVGEAAPTGLGTINDNETPQGVNGVEFDYRNYALYNDPDITATNTLKYNGNCLESWHSSNNQSATWGSNIQTGNYNDKYNDYDHFANATIPNDFLISSLCKKIILPVLDKFRTYNYDAYPANLDYTYDPLVYTPDAAGTSANNTLNGCPKPGYMICTVDIGQSSGWYDTDGTAYYERGHKTGMVNLKSGPQSVVGKILAVRPIKHQTTDTMSTTGKTRIEIDSFEVFVYDCFNPAQVNEMLTYTAPANTLVGSKKTQEILKTQEGVVVKSVHGAPEYRLGYSPNPSFNHINGMFQSQRPTTASWAGVPMGNNYNDGDIQNTLIDPTNYFNGPVVGIGLGEPRYQTGSDLEKEELSEFDYGYGKPMGLSYLWSGSHTGSLIYQMNNGHANDAGGNLMPPTNFNFRENTMSYMGKVGTDTTWEFKIHNNKRVWDGNPVNANLNVIVEPVADNTDNFNICCGALVCCPPEEMDNIIKGYYTTNTLLARGQEIVALCNGVAGNVAFTCQDITGLTTDFYINFSNGISTVTRNIIAVTPTAGLTGTITMDALVETTFNKNITFNNPTGYLPRVWIPWSYQLNESNYYERHGKGNSLASDNTMTNAQAAATDARVGLPKNGVSVQEENRFDIGFAAQPTNWNWRSPYSVNKDNFDQSAGYPALPRGGTAAVTTNNSIGDPSDADDNFTNNDRCPRYYSTPDGRRLAPAGGLTDFLKIGAPYVWGGYQTTNNSIYFQQPETGDTNLGLTHTSPKINATVVGSVITATTITSQTVDLTDYYVQSNKVLDTGIQVQTYTAGVGTDAIIFKDRAGAALNLTATLLNGDLLFFSKEPPGFCGAGTNAVEWAADHLMLKEYNMKIEVDKGFYTNEHIAAEINKIMHRSTVDYAADNGTYNATKNVFEVPTTVGIKEQSRASENSLVNANFIQSYIPDLSYGFLPVTSENAAKLGQTASTKELNINTIDSYDANTQTWTYYYNWQSDLPLGESVKTMTATPCGTHCKFYSVPYLDKTTHAAGQQTQLHLFKLKGGALSFLDFDSEGGTVPNWQNKFSRTQRIEAIASTAGGECPYFFWQSRYNRNLMANGGAARIFAGANNATFQYNEVEQRLQFTNLYTPYRPHDSTNPNKADFDIGDAIPAAIINARKSGATIGSICGLYITNLNADAITTANYGTDYYNNILYDTDTTNIVQTRGLTFLGQLGFSPEQITNFSNSLDIVSTPFTFVNRTQFFGNTLTTRPKIDTAINASNPAVSNCTEVAPVRQFYAEVESETISADNPSTRGTNPFYLIGSDFPGSQFYGSVEGQHLPVIGICSRNFSAFNFVFDLGGSSITFTIDQKVSLKSIKTEIYTARLGTPNNLDDYSSVIYLVTKAKYVNQITQPELIKQVAEILEANTQARIQGAFYNPSQASYRVGVPPGMNKEETKLYYESEGSYYPTSDTETEDNV